MSMRAVLFRATIEHIEITPYVRMTQASKWSKQARKYLVSQATLAWEFKKHWNGNGHGPIDYPVEISYAVHRKRWADNSNILKALEDALQYAGIVENDKWIQGTGRTRTYRDDKSRVIVELRRL